MCNENRRKVLFTLSFVLIFILIEYNICTAVTQKDINIEGAIKGVPADSEGTIYLFSFYGSELSEFDKAQLDETGNFKFTLHTLPQGMYKLGFDVENAAHIVLSDKEKNIIIKADYEGLEADNIIVNNSRENDVYSVLRKEHEWFTEKTYELNEQKFQISTVDRSFVRKTREIDNKIGALIGKHNKQLIHIKEAYPDTFTSEVLINLFHVPQLSNHPELKKDYDNERAFMHDHFLDFIDFADERIIYAPFLTDIYNTYLNDYTHHIQEGFKASADVLLDESRVNNTVFEFTIQYLIDVFKDEGPAELVDYVVDNVDNIEGCEAPLSEATVEKIRSIKKLRVGQLAPDIASTGPDGRVVALSSSIGNKALMLYFWASWCSFCQEENPNLVKIYNQFKNKGFRVYAVALDEDKAAWLSAIESQELKWTNVSDLKGWDSESAKTYNVSATPATYLLDKDGRIIAKNLRSNALKMKLEEILN